MKKILASFLLTVLLTPQSRATEPGQDQKLWAGAVQNTLDFFNRNAWDANSGTYASEIDRSGAHLTENRDIVALGRMIYGNAKAPADAQNLGRARLSALFILQNMMARDAFGIYFKSSVDAQGREVSSGRNYTFSFEQAYPIAGLIALYSADPQTNADLLPTIREAAQSFWKRFADRDRGGLFYYYNFAKMDHANDQGETHKSYQSTIYPVSSFLFALRKADPANLALYDSWISQLLDIAVQKMVEVDAQGPTGFLLERMDADFRIDETYTMTEAGHIHQLAWVLLTAVRENIVTAAPLRQSYTQLAVSLLEKFIDRQGLSPIGVVFDAFDRRAGTPWLDPSTQTPTSAWWSNLEAIIAYHRALQDGVLSTARATQVEAILSNLTRGYFQYFVDPVYGGDFFRINALNAEVVDATKGAPGKSAYHITETYEALFSK